MNFLKQNIDITNLSNYKTKAIAKYYFEIHDLNDLKLLVSIYNFANLKSIPILFIGGGTNLLFAFDVYNGVVIKNYLQGWNYDENNKLLGVYSNEFVSNIATQLLDTYDQNIWKRFIGLPGSVGGAIFGNAGCFGLEIQNNFYKAEVLDLSNGLIKIFLKKDMDFKYRKSIIKKSNKYFIVKGYFDLSKKVEKYSSSIDNIDFRENKQPKGDTCGSFFKNPSKDYSAGKLIEEIGFKGKMVGGAFFSNKHANFLMSDGTATYKDLLGLIKLTQKNIKKTFDIDLIPEVRIIYN